MNMTESKSGYQSCRGLRPAAKNHQFTLCQEVFVSNLCWCFVNSDFTKRPAQFSYCQTVHQTLLFCNHGHGCKTGGFGAHYRFHVKFASLFLITFYCSMMNLSQPGHVDDQSCGWKDKWTSITRSMQIPMSLLASLGQSNETTAVSRGGQYL